ncbi:MAG: hypothetical protein JXQ72_06730 [Anaerolineae bacterium]|nr:hypothetical protein [Anaerolineae bacterium]
MYYREKLRITLFTTIVLWAGVGMLHAVLGEGSFVAGFAAVIAFLATARLWSALVVPILQQPTDMQPREKAKRHGGFAADDDADARLSLLIALMSERERDAIRQQLTGDLDADGEALSLADLIAAQDHVIQDRAGSRDGEGQ